MALTANWELRFPGADGKHMVRRVPGEDFPRHWRVPMAETLAEVISFMTDFFDAINEKRNNQYKIH